MNAKNFAAMFFSMAICICLNAKAESNSEQEESKDAQKNMKALAQSNADFAFKFYAQMRNADGNLFISPFSISTALAMTCAGARGETQKEMQQALSFTLGQTELHSTFSRLITEINSINSDGKCELLMANAIWPQKDYKFLDSYVSIVRDNYYSQITPLDFSDKSSSALINAWVSDKTKGKITQIVDDLDALVRLVITNAIYFKGGWASKFETNKTETAPFKLENGSSIPVKMMTQQADFKYFEDEELQALELPYRQKRLTMVVILPKNGKKLEEIESRLDAAKFAGLVSKFWKRQVTVFLPKFRIETELMNIKGPLCKLGIQNAFTRAADFSGMTGEKDLYISEVFHKAFVEVSEEGTEAAAATSVTMRLTCAPPSEEKTVFKADHPFIFAIRDSETDSIFFLGRLSIPERSNDVTNHP